MRVQTRTVSIAVTVNGREHRSEVEPGKLLVDYLREDLGLTGTKVGCETGQCGACTILLDGTSVKGCTVLAAQADGSAVTTIEGLGVDSQLNPLQQALWEAHAVQCGYCAPAMTLALTDLLARHSKPTDAEIRGWLDGIMCRCGVYQNAIRAVQAAAAGAAEGGR
jgi:aerobic carbon-monoxide dehydrogenase small subunit